MQDDRIREAFQNVRYDIDVLFQEIEKIKAGVEENRATNESIKRTLEIITTQIAEIQSNQQGDATLSSLPDTNASLEAPEMQNKVGSSGNKGVPTNKPTDQQTNQHSFISSPNAQIQAFESKIDHLERVSEIIGSLDELKKEVRIKFKQLTKQEMMIFATIYQLEEQGLVVDYSLLAEQLGLTEISIRDYTRKIIKKGIPLIKHKENNKKVILKIPVDLKKVASLNTILELREL